MEIKEISLTCTRIPRHLKPQFTLELDYIET
jgi:hypothetical protein